MTLFKRTDGSIIGATLEIKGRHYQLKVDTAEQAADYIATLLIAKDLPRSSREITEQRLINNNILIDTENDNGWNLNEENFPLSRLHAIFAELSDANSFQIFQVEPKAVFSDETDRDIAELIVKGSETMLENLTRKKLLVHAPVAKFAKLKMEDLRSTQQLQQNFGDKSR